MAVAERRMSGSPKVLVVMAPKAMDWLAWPTDSVWVPLVLARYVVPPIVACAKDAVIACEPTPSDAGE